jgi:hypothetical protein
MGNKLMEMHAIKRVECLMPPTFYAYLEADASDEKKAARVVSRWADKRLFPGAVFYIVYTSGSTRCVGWNEIALLYDLKPRKEHVHQAPAPELPKTAAVRRRKLAALAQPAPAALPPAPAVVAPEPVGPRVLERLVMRRGKLVAVSYEAREAA